MPRYEIEITAEEEKVLVAVLGNGTEITEWLQHAIKNKARKRMDIMISESTKYDPKKLTDQERKDEIDKLDLSDYRSKQNIVVL